MSKRWSPSKHPRGQHGRFKTNGGSGGGGKKKGKKPSKDRYEGMQVLTNSGKLRPLTGAEKAVMEAHRKRAIKANALVLGATVTAALVGAVMSG